MCQYVCANRLLIVRSIDIAAFSFLTFLYILYCALLHAMLPYIYNIPIKKIFVFFVHIYTWYKYTCTWYIFVYTNTNTRFFFIYSALRKRYDHAAELCRLQFNSNIDNILHSTLSAATIPNDSLLLMPVHCMYMYSTYTSLHTSTCKQILTNPYERCLYAFVCTINTMMRPHSVYVRTIHTFIRSSLLRQRQFFKMAVMYFFISISVAI